MKVKFTARDGGKCVVCIAKRNLNRMRRRWPDLQVVVEQFKDLF